MKQAITRITLMTLPLMLFVLLSACNRPNQQTEATVTPNITQVYQTVEARLTESASTTLPSPSPQFTPTLQTTPTPLITAPTTQPAPSATQSPPQNTPTPQKLCDQAAAGTPIDVTIPDDTSIPAGQAFIKIWRLVNVGTCTWDSSYAAVFFSGEQMGAQAVVPLRGQVAPGQSVDIQVDMVAPLTPGTYQGNWKLRNKDNVLFGIGPNGSAPFWVRIQVLTTASVTPSPTTTNPPPSVTPTMTLTPPQPAVQVSGPAQLNLGDQLDLDTLQLNTGSGQDLLYARNANNQPELSVLGNAAFSVFGSSRPDSQSCAADDLIQTPLLLESLSSGDYLCYRTDQGRWGWARLVSFDTTGGPLNLEILTWALP